MGSGCGPGPDGWLAAGRPRAQSPRGAPCPLPTAHHITHNRLQGAGPLPRAAGRFPPGVLNDLLWNGPSRKPRRSYSY
jgi:hypothetical protein